IGPLPITIATIMGFWFGCSVGAFMNPGRSLEWGRAWTLGVNGIAWILATLIFVMVFVPGLMPMTTLMIVVGAPLALFLLTWAVGHSKLSDKQKLGMLIFALLLIVVGMPLVFSFTPALL